MTDRTDAQLLRLIAKDHARLAPNAYHSAETLVQIADRLDAAASETDIFKLTWRDISTAPLDGTEFLAQASNGWRILAKAPTGLNGEGAFQWWITGGMGSFPIVSTHYSAEDWGGKVLLVKWMPLPPTAEQLDRAEP
jgi:hypothetical protein